MKTNTDAGIQIQVYYLHALAAWVQVRTQNACVKETVKTWLQRINPHPFGQHAVVQLVARYLNEWAIPVTAITMQHIKTDSWSNSRNQLSDV